MKMKKTIAITLACAMALSGTGNLFTPKKAKAASGYNLSNPTTDSSDLSTWDCIYFGHYWQDDTNGDGSADRNDEKQQIKWRVLSVDGDDAFILADQNLDAKAYNETYTDVTWENCTMRSWLNGYGASANKDKKDFTSDNFFDNAFSTAEQNAIQTTNVVNEDNPYYGTDGGNDTEDKVYLLSISEASNALYGFNSNYKTNSKTRESKNTAYTASKSGMNYAGHTDLWWLRTPGGSAYRASYVCLDGYGSYDDFYSVYNTSVAVRPALHINLSSSNLWSYAGTVSSEGGSKPTAAPVVGEKVDTEKITASVCEYGSFERLDGAQVSIEGIGDMTTDSHGNAEISNTQTEPSVMRKITVKKDGYRDYIYYTTIVAPNVITPYTVNKVSVSLVKKKSDDDIKPYVSSVVYYRNEMAQKCGGQRFSGSEIVKFRACGVWNDKTPSSYVMYQQGGKSFESKDGIFKLDMGSSFSGKGKIYVKMVAEDGTESEPEWVYISVPEKSSASDDGYVSLLNNNTAETDVLEGIPFFNGSKLSLDIGKLKTSVSYKDGKVRIMLGGKKDWDLLKDEDWEKWKKFCESQPVDLSLSQWKNVLTSGNMESPFTTEVKPKFTGYGWLEGDADSDTPLTGGFQFVLDAGVTYKQQYVVGTIPIYLEAGFKSEGKAEGSVTYDWKNKKFQGDNKITITPSFSVGGGIGVLYVATVGAEGSAGMPMELNVPNGVKTVKVSGSLSLKASVLGFEYSNEIAKKEWVLYDKDKKSAQSLDDTSDSKDIFIKQFNEKQKSKRLYESQSYKLPEKKTADAKWYGDRKALSAKSISGTESLKETLLQQGTSELTEPMLISENGTTIAVFLTEDSSRDIIHRTKLVYTVYDENTSLWSEPKAVDDDGTGDFVPYLTTSNGKIMVSWLNYSNQLTDKSSMDEAASSSSLCYAVWNNEKNEFEKADGQINSDSSATYNSMKTLADSSGNIVHIGLKNTASDIFGINGKNVLFIKGKYGAGEFDKEIAISQGIPVSYDVFGNDDDIKTAVCVDTDNDMTTLDDREIFIYSSDGSVKQISDNSEYDGAPRYALYNGKTALYWYNDNGYHILDDSGKETVVDKEEIGTISENFNVVANENGNTAIAYSTANEDGTYQLSVCIYDSADNKWNSQVILTDSAQNIFRASGYYNKDGSMEFMYRKGSTIDSGSLYTLQADAQPDAQIVDAYLKDGTEVAGQTTKMYVVVKNKGIKKIEDYSFDIDGAETTGNTTINPGESTVIEVPYKVPDEVTSRDINISMNVDGDKAISDNSITIKGGYTDLSLSLMEDSTSAGKIVDVVVSNNEAVSADAVLEVHEDSETGKLVSTRNLGTIKQGEIVTTSYTYKMGQNGYDGADRLYYVVKTDSEEKYSSNNTDFVVFPKEESSENPEVTQSPAATSTTSPQPDNTADATASPDITKEPAASVNPTASPTKTPTVLPAVSASPKPTSTAKVTALPTKTPTALPAVSVSPKPTSTAKVTASPTKTPSVSPTPNATEQPTAAPTPVPNATEQPAPAPTPTPNVTEQPAPTNSETPSVTNQPIVTPTKTPSKAVKVKKGTVIKDKKTKASYKVLSVKAGAMTVEYLKPASKKIKSVSIKTYITYKGKKYKIVKIADKAFMNCKKLKKVTVGKNVKTIGRKAFANCKALKTVQIPKGFKKSKIPKNVFAGCKKKPRIKVVK